MNSTRDGGLLSSGLSAVLVTFIAAQCLAASFQLMELPYGQYGTQDLDGDGRAELIIEEHGSRALWIYWNHRGHGWRRKPDQELVTPSAPLFCDLDKDGAQDLVTFCPTQVHVHWHQEGRHYAAKPDQTVIFHKCPAWVDFGNVLGDKRLELIEVDSEGLFCRSQSDRTFSSTRVALLARPSVFSLFRDTWHALKPCNFAMDLDGDALDDFILYQTDGVEIILNKELSQLDQPQRLALPIYSRISVAQTGRFLLDNSLESKTCGGSGIGVTLPQVEARDLDEDGRSDLVLPTDRLYFRQDANGKFVREPWPEGASLGLPARGAGGGTPSTLDVNGDGIEDDIEFRIPPKNLATLKTQVALFLGRPDGSLPTLPDQVFAGKNLLVFSLPAKDFDRDGDLDLVMYSTDFQITEIAKWLKIQAGKVDGELQFYLFDKRTRQFVRQDESKFRTKIKLDYKLEAEDFVTGGIFRFIYTILNFDGDYNGDGNTDVLVRSKRDVLAMHFYRSPKGPFFVEKPDIELRVPSFNSYELLDLNKDGVSDILLDGRTLLLSKK